MRRIIAGLGQRYKANPLIRGRGTNYPNPKRYCNAVAHIFYAYVDSWEPGSTWGSVLEEDEENNRFGPVVK